ncbi:MAG: flotillin family protein, partial [Prochlorococcus sp.]
AALEARAKSQQQLQLVRAELERLRLRAEEVLPAQAEQKALELKARGNAAATAEDAKASALVNNLLTQVWEEAGDEAEVVFLLQQIEMVLHQAASLPRQLHLKRITAVDGNGSASLAGLMSLYPNVVKQFLEQVRDTLGIDVLGTLNSSGDQS